MERGPEVNSCSSTCAISYSLQAEVSMTWQILMEGGGTKWRSEGGSGQRVEERSGGQERVDQRELVAGLIQQIPVVELACMYLVTWV